MMFLPLSVLLLLTTASAAPCSAPTSAASKCPTGYAIDVTLSTNEASFFCIEFADGTLSTGTYESSSCGASLQNSDFAALAHADPTFKEITFAECRAIVEGDGSISALELSGASNGNEATFVSFSRRAATTSQVLADQPAAFYRLGKVFGADSSGNGHTLELDGTDGVNTGATSLFAGDADQAVTFDGVQLGGGRLKSPNFEKGLLGSTTVEFWIHSPAIPLSTCPIVSDGEIFETLPDFQLKVYMFNDGSGSGPKTFTPHYSCGFTEFDASFALTSPTHVVAVHESGTSTVDLYIDGIAVGSKRESEFTEGCAPATDNPIFIGPDNSEPAQFAGTIDDVAIYDSALTANQVAAHFAGTQVSACGSADLLLSSGSHSAPNDHRKRQVSQNLFPVTSTMVSSIHGNVNGDPHFVGANGVKFDFNGQPNGEYVLFSAPQLQVNMHLAGDGPAIRFMTKIAVVFRNVTIQVGVFRLDPAFVNKINAQLAPLGAKASYNGWQFRLNLCPGHEVIVSQHHANKKLRPSLVHDDGSVFYYLDIAINTPHCNDAYGGALGQTYKCVYVEGREEFKFDHASEESFRVKALTAVDESSFNADAPCSFPHAAAAAAAKRTMSGGASH